MTPPTEHTKTMVRFDRRERRRAFTMTEMLVVISIIALLAAMLMPALGAARNAARKAACRHRFVKAPRRAVAQYGFGEPVFISAWPAAGPLTATGVRAV